MTVYLKTSSIKLLIKLTHITLGELLIKVKKNTVDLPPGCPVLWWPLSCQAASTSRERRHCSCRTPRQNLRTQPCARGEKILQTLLLLYTLTFWRPSTQNICYESNYASWFLGLVPFLKKHKNGQYKPILINCPCISVIPFSVKTILLFLLFLFTWFNTNFGRQRFLREL